MASAGDGLWLSRTVAIARAHPDKLYSVVAARPTHVVAIRPKLPIHLWQPSKYIKGLVSPREIPPHRNPPKQAVIQRSGRTFSARGRTSFQSITTYTSSSMPFFRRFFNTAPFDLVTNAAGIVIFFRYLHCACNKHAGLQTDPGLADTDCSILGPVRRSCVILLVWRLHGGQLILIVDNNDLLRDALHGEVRIQAV